MDSSCNHRINIGRDVFRVSKVKPVGIIGKTTYPKCVAFYKLFSIVYTIYMLKMTRTWQQSILLPVNG